jgi:hypothetical protein
VGNVLLSRIMVADVRLDPSGFDIGIRESWEDALASVEENGGKSYAIPAGASDHGIAAIDDGLGFHGLPSYVRIAALCLRRRRRGTSGGDESVPVPAEATKNLA